ncbi:MAG: ATP-dependent zinc metalloprotease FtsH [Elusimicrobia bacterium]|nr:ATP-dependent zinc metalloprotease FtsH [Elusimicrobiota bacterium]
MIPRLLSLLLSAALLAPSPAFARSLASAAASPVPSVGAPIAPLAGANSFSPRSGERVAASGLTTLALVKPIVPLPSSTRVRAEYLESLRRLAEQGPSAAALARAYHGDGAAADDESRGVPAAPAPARKSELARPSPRPAFLAVAAGAPVAAQGAAAAGALPAWAALSLIGGGIVGLMLLVRWIEGSVRFQYYLARRRWVTATGKGWDEADEATRVKVKAGAEKIVARNRAGRVESWSDLRRHFGFERGEPNGKPEAPPPTPGRPLGLRTPPGQPAQEPAKPKITFADVAGQDEAKRELLRVVRFLNDPEPYTRLGAKGFRGILLFGPPGTGKSLMARALAGEANATYVERKGSDFVNKYVGVGPESVRKAFSEARTDGKKPGILFIDEIDAVGKSRSNGDGNEEYENTLNSLLAEMSDPKNDNVVVVAATNRPELLDAALMRGRRLGLQVPVGLPDLEGRAAILGVHSKNMKLGPDVDLKQVAKLTPKLSGADLEEVANDAAMMAAEEKAEHVSMPHFRRAIDRRVIGHERKLAMAEPEKAVVSAHESGHALTAWLLPGADPIRKITIVPHGLQALGLVQTVAEEERFMYSREWLQDRIAVALGGRVAEELVTGEQFSGASNDLEQATRIARMMVMKFGMSPKIGLVSYDVDGERPNVGRAQSQRRQNLIEQEVQRILDEQHARVKKLLTDNRAVLDRLSAALREKETLREADLDTLLPPRPAR